MTVYLKDGTEIECYKIKFYGMDEDGNIVGYLSFSANDDKTFYSYSDLDRIEN